MLVVASEMTGFAQDHRPPRHRNLPPSTPMVHDVAVAYENGTYHLMSTGHGLQHCVSKDMEEWQLLPLPVISHLPEWTHDSVPNTHNHVWAPDIIRYRGKWWLAYSYSVFGKNFSAIGLMSADELSDSIGWRDEGALVCSKSGRDNWNAIDPNFIIDQDGSPWLTFGSFWDGIQLVRLDSTMHIAPGARQTTIARHKVNSRASAIEAPFIYYRDGYFYLFASWDICCQAEKSTYKVVVGRSKSVQGPYLDKQGVDMADGGGTLIAAGDGKEFYAMGHCAIYDFEGQTMFFCHGYSVEHEGTSLLVKRPVKWTDDGWPEL